MTSIADFCITLSSLQVQLPTIVQESLTDTREIAIERQKAQLMAGVDNTETPIKPPYAPSTIARKKRKGQPYDRVTGYDKGNMYAETDDNITETTFTLFSTSYTFGKFIARYGENVYGLTLYSLQVVRDATEPILIDKCRNYLGL